MRLFSSSALVLAAALVGSASAARQPREYYEERFVNWMKEHDVQFESGAEFAHRLGVFADNHGTKKERSLLACWRCFRHPPTCLQPAPVS